MNEDHFEMAWQNESGKIIPFLMYEGDLNQTIEVNRRLFLSTSHRTGGHSFMLEVIGVKRINTSNAVGRGFHMYYFGTMLKFFKPYGYHFKFSMSKEFKLTMIKRRIEAPLT
jgi:hypothetical protein